MLHNGDTNVLFRETTAGGKRPEKNRKHSFKMERKKHKGRTWVNVTMKEEGK